MCLHFGWLLLQGSTVDLANWLERRSLKRSQDSEHLDQATLEYEILIHDGTDVMGGSSPDGILYINFLFQL